MNVQNLVVYFFAICRSGTKWRFYYSLWKGSKGLHGPDEVFYRTLANYRTSEKTRIVRHLTSKFILVRLFIGSTIQSLV
jgi:hypothetical protein